MPATLLLNRGFLSAGCSCQIGYVDMRGVAMAANAAAMELAAGTHALCCGWRYSYRVREGVVVR